MWLNFNIATNTYTFCITSTECILIVTVLNMIVLHSLDNKKQKELKESYRNSIDTSRKQLDNDVKLHEKSRIYEDIAAMYPTDLEVVTHIWCVSWNFKENLVACTTHIEIFAVNRVSHILELAHQNKKCNTACGCAVHTSCYHKL